MRLSRRQLIAGLPATGLLSANPSQPVLSVDVPAPTRDKPQSKLWFAQGCWWAWLPVQGGSSVWRRNSHGGWQRERQLDDPLRGFPGQADVCTGGAQVRAVLVEPRRLAVATLQWTGGGYRVDGAVDAFDLSAETETATIAHESSRGSWWIAYNADRHMWVRTSGGAQGGWSQPVRVSHRACSADDICAVIALSGEIAVMWSNQADDAMYFRRHRNGAPPDRWEPVETVEQGGRNADDHLNLATADGRRLAVATKNSVDRIGSPQQVLRMRDARGVWTNHPYAILTPVQQPTRPIVQVSPDGRRLFLLHTVAVRGTRPPRSFIVVQSLNASRIRLDSGVRTLIQADAAINNVTGSKAPLPAGQPWIVLASDDRGRVYEGRIAEA